MDIRILIGAVLVVIIVSAGVGYVKESAPGALPEPEVAEAPEPEPVAEPEPEHLNGTGTLASLMDAEGAYRCTIEEGESQIASSGTIYIALGKLRGDFRTRVSGGITVASHVIATDGYVYTWSDFSSKGIVTALDLSGRAPGELLSSAVHYYCSPWEADQNVFVLPPGVSFAHP